MNDIIYPNILSGVCAFNCHSVASKCRNIIVKMMLPTGQCVAATVEAGGHNNNKIGPEHITNIYTARRAGDSPC